MLAPCEGLYFSRCDTNMTQQEINLPPPEGIIPPPMKTEAPHIIQIPLFNSSANDNFVDLGSQYGGEDMGNITQAPKLWAPSRGMDEGPKVFDKYKILEERLRGVQSFNVFSVDALDMCLIPNMVIPPKFKVPEFEQYKGLNFPGNHLRIFNRNMDAYTHDEKLMMHCFQDSLSEASSGWYMQIEWAHI